MNRLKKNLIKKQPNKSTIDTTTTTTTTTKPFSPKQVGVG
jgi:hypothetical protein